MSPWKKIICALAALALGACASTTSGAAVSEIARPDAAPQRAATRFDTALRCMDDQFADYGVKGLTVAVSGVPDFTGRLFVGSDIWMQHAVTRMSQRSGAFVVTDFNPNTQEQVLWNFLSEKRGFYVPLYYIRGAISGFADQITFDNATAGVGALKYDFGAGGTRAQSLLSVDLSVGDLAQRTLIARASTGNEIALQSKSAGAQIGGRLSKLGANLELTFSRSDGIPQAVRTLEELGAIEILGRLTGVPYYSCLGATFESPDAQRIRRDVFDNMTSAERVVFAQRRLSRLGFYTGPFDGQASPATVSAIARYSAARNMPAYGPEDFRLYEYLSRWRADGEVKATVAAAAPTTLPVSPAALAQQSLRIDLNILTGSGPGSPAFLQLRSGAPTFAYCYLQDGGGVVARVYPNRWQPDALVRPGSALTIPAQEAGFKLVLPAAGVEERLLCIGSDRELGSGLPDALKLHDLAPLPVRRLEDLIEAFRAEAVRRSGAITVTQHALSARGAQPVR